MLTICWSPKGGSGVTVVAAALALLRAAQGDETLLVDASGDLPGALGMPSSSGEGLSDWLRARSDVPVDALTTLEVTVVERLQLLKAGTAVVENLDERLAVAADLFSLSSRAVVVDAGGAQPPAAWFVGGVRSVMVLRACYLGVRRAVASPLPPATVIVLIEEAGRALRAAEVAAVFHGCPMIVVPWDPAVSRAVDAGLLAHRLPRSLLRLSEVFDA